MTKAKFEVGDIVEYADLGALNAPLYKGNTETSLPLGSIGVVRAAEMFVMVLFDDVPVPMGEDQEWCMHESEIALSSLPTVHDAEGLDCLGAGAVVQGVYDFSDAYRYVKLSTGNWYNEYFNKVHARIDPGDFCVPNIGDPVPEAPTYESTATFIEIFQAHLMNTSVALLAANASLLALFDAYNNNNKEN